MKILIKFSSSKNPFFRLFLETVKDRNVCKRGEDARWNFLQGGKFQNFIF